MEEHGLLEKKVEKRNMRGRPKYMIKPTILGKDYLETYEALKLKTLRSRKNGLKKTIKDAEYVKRLEARNLSPFRLFLELNSLSQPIIEMLCRVASFLDKSEIEYMLIGGCALPFYGAIRVTIDIDIAVAIEGKE